MKDNEAIESALRWHAKWRKPYWAKALSHQDECHLLIHAAVEGMLAADGKLARIAEDAEKRGIDSHEVRHCLGRAFTFGMWYQRQEGIEYDDDVLAKWFQEQLQAAEQREG